MCTSRCPTKIHIKNGRITRIKLVDAIPCPRAQAQLDFIYHPDRLKYPLKRQKDGSFERISWDEALDTVAQNLQKIKDEYGPEAVAFWVAYTKEPRPYFHRLTHAFGSPNYCTESSSCASTPILAANLTYGPGIAPFNLPFPPTDLRCRIIWGSSVKNSSPTAWPATLKDRRKVKLIVVDPRRTEIAAMAEIHLQPRPGTDGALALGMMNVIIGEGLYDKGFVKNWTVGFEDLEKLVQAYPPERVEEITRVSATKIREAARLYATQKPAQLSLSPNSTTQHTNGFQNHRAIILLPAITGNIKPPAVRYKLPLNDITLHERVAGMPPGVGALRFPLWTKLYREMQSNALADQIDRGQPYPIKALFSAGLNLHFFPNSNRMVASLGKLDFIAVTEYFLTPSAKLADIVLPIASWVERPILITGPDSARLITPAIDPIGESWPEWQIYAELARRLGCGGEFWDGSFERCVDYILEPSGLSFAYLKEHPEGAKYSPVSTRRPGSEARFGTPSGRVEIASSTLAKYGMEPLPVYQEPPESPLSRPDLAVSYPLVLTTGARVLAYTNSQLRNIERLRRMVPEPLVDINPTDAAPRGIKTGDAVTISSPRGSIRMKAKVTDTILSGVVSIPHHWPGDADANLLTDDQGLDPISGFPPFKSQLCQVTRC